MPNPRALATRSRILAAAERLFAERGFSNVSMPAIAEASGITAGAIYKHFPSKAALFFEVMHGAVVAGPAPAAGAAALPALVAGYTGRRMKLLRQLAVEAHYAAAKDPQVRRMLRHALEAQIADIRAAIEAGQAAGAIDPSLDAGMTAAAVFVLIMGLMHGETLTPELVGDEAWRAFIESRVAALIGAPG